MPTSAPPFDAAGFLTLREMRRFLRRSRAMPVAVFFAVVYALGSMLWGQMLSLVPLQGGTTVEILTGSGTGQGWWNYPGLLVVAPWGVLSLPFFPTIAMVVVAAGVGLGMAVAAALIVRLVRPSREEAARSKAVGAVTGLTPAMISLVTLGSCCTTTAAATGGIGLIAQASGTSTANLLLNNWYLGVAQLAIVGAALLAQELLLTVYGGLLGTRGSSPSSRPVVAPPLDRRWTVGSLLRAALAIGGVLWSISMFAEWTTVSPATAGAGWWFGWVIQHQLLAGVAVGAAFFPVEVSSLLRSWRRGVGRALRAAFAVAAVSLLVWLPPPLPAWGLDSFGGELAGALGVPAAWGAIPLGSVTGAALVVRWALEFVIPAGFVLFAATAPERAFVPLLYTVARQAPSSAPSVEVVEPIPASVGGPVVDAAHPSTADRRGSGGTAVDVP